MNAHRLRNEMPFGWPTLIFFGLTVGSMLVWGFLSVFWFAQALSVDQLEAWIPAVATTGTMLVSSRLAALDNIEHRTRIEATGLAVLAVFGDVVITSVQHYLQVIASNPHNIHPGPYWGGVLGGIPSLMAAILIHVGWQIRKDHRAAQAAAQTARIEAAQERDRQARAETVVIQARADAAADHARHQAELDAAAQREAAILREQRLAAETQIRVDEAKAQVAARETQLVTTRQAAAQAETERLREQTRLEELLAGEQEMPVGSGRLGGHTNADPVSPDPTSKTGPDVTALLPVGREIAAELARTGTELTRPALAKALKARHVPCGTDRAAELLRQLRAEAVTGHRSIEGRSDRPLTGVTAR